MTNIYEATNYDISWRGVLYNKDNFKLFTNNSSIEVTSEISFDINSDNKSSLNYFASSILGGITHSIISNSKNANLDIEELEGKIHLVLKNPLTLLGVKGYEDEPKIKECNITFYLYADTDEENLIKFCKESLKRCFIYNTLKEAITFNIKFLPID